MRTETADVVILGGGAAGLSAALAAAEAGASVALVSKVYPMRSHTVAAEGGAAGVHRASDSVELHAADTIRAGAGLAEPAAVNYVVSQAPVELARLERLGMPFSRTDDGDVATRPFGGMSQPRTWYAADKTGFHLLHTLFQTVLQYPNVKLFAEYFALDLILPSSGMGALDSAASAQSDGSASAASHTENLVKSDNVSQVGLLTYSQGDGEPVFFVSPALVIATGGYARAWGTSTNAAIVTGDGQALALRAGLPLRDMEFVQWHPTCLPGSGFLITEAARGEGGVLLDKDGKRYLAAYGLGPETPIGQPEARRMELGPRDALSQAFASAVADGRTRKLPYSSLVTSSLDSATATPTGKLPQSGKRPQLRNFAQNDGQGTSASGERRGPTQSSCAQSQRYGDAGPPGTRLIDVVDLDLTHLGPGVLKEKLPLILDLAKRYARVDATKQPIPICPAAHYTMGGIPTDVDGRVLDVNGQPVPGVYAAGECASTGLHGANRLGSNSLVETLVMGRTAGTAASAGNAFAQNDELVPTVTEHLLNQADQAWRGWFAMLGSGNENHYQLQSELGELLDQHFGIRITTEGLAAAASGIEKLRDRYAHVRVDDLNDKYNTDWQQAVELGFMLDCARATVAAAQARHESRGAFQNLDYPDTEPTPQHSEVKQLGSELLVELRGVALDSATSATASAQNDGGVMGLSYTSSCTGSGQHPLAIVTEAGRLLSSCCTEAGTAVAAGPSDLAAGLDRRGGDSDE